MPGYDNESWLTTLKISS